MYSFSSAFISLKEKRLMIPYLKFQINFISINERFILLLNHFKLTPQLNLKKNFLRVMLISLDSKEFLNISKILAHLAF